MKKLYAAKQVASVLRKSMISESFMEIRRHTKLKQVVEKMTGFQKLRISFAKWKEYMLK